VELYYPHSVQRKMTPCTWPSRYFPDEGNPSRVKAMTAQTSTKGERPTGSVRLPPTGLTFDEWERLDSALRYQLRSFKTDPITMTNTERSTHSPSSVESVIADAGEKGQEALSYAGQKGREAMDNVREVGDTFAVAVQKSIKTRPYTTLALAVAAGFLFGATWRR
jgi:hypothetical protein